MRDVTASAPLTQAPLRQITLPIARSATPAPILYWHLLSLDAPTVAAVWTIFIARSAQVPLPAAAPAAMFLGVWIIYATDRLMDARRGNNLEARHRFHGRHRTGFSLALALAAIALLPLIAIMHPRTLHAYLGLGGLLLLWLALVHLLSPLRRMPKEIAVGFFFAAAVFIPTLSRQWQPRLILPAFFVANLCSLNCLFIYAWEHPRLSAPNPCPDPHPTTSFGLRSLRAIAIASILLPLLAIPFSVQPLPLFAASLSAAALLLLHSRRRHIDRTTLRAAADLALLSPLLLLAFLR